MKEKYSICSEKTNCTVEALASELGVSEVTIRRDLKKLDGEELLHRCHCGAASRNYSDTKVPSILVRENYNVVPRRNVASKAVALIQRKSTIFIDSSSTCLCLAGFLTPEMELTVVTNSLHLAEELMGKHILVYCLAGKYYEYAKAVFGEYAEESVGAFRFDMAFLASRGIIPGDAAYDTNEHEASLWRKCIKQSDRVAFLCLSAKIGKRYAMRSYSTSFIDDFVCENEESERILRNGQN